LSIVNLNDVTLAETKADI